MDFKLPIPTLKHTSLVKVLGMFLDVYFAKDSLSVASSNFMPSKIVDKIKKLELPEILKEELTSLLEIMCRELYLWADLNERFSRLPEVFLWTPYGTIDYEKMAEMLVENDRIDILERYQLACIYCLEKEIFCLWRQLDPESRNLHEIRENEINYLMIYWSHYVEGELHNLDIHNLDMWPGAIFDRNIDLSPVEFGLIYSQRERYKEATRYFLKKLEESHVNPLIREKISTDCLISCETFCLTMCDVTVSSNRKSDFLCLVLSQLCEKQQKELFGNNTLLFHYFVHWPWCNLIVDVLNLTWDFLSKEYYEVIFESLCKRLLRSYQNLHYLSIFNDFWNATPIVYKRHVINNLGSETSLHNIVPSKILKYVLDAATAEEKGKILSIREKRELC